MIDEVVFLLRISWPTRLNCQNDNNYVTGYS